MRYIMTTVAVGAALTVGTSTAAATLSEVTTTDPVISASGGEATFLPGFTPGTFDVVSFTPASVTSASGSLTTNPAGFEFSYNLSGSASGLSFPTGFDIIDPSSSDVFLAADTIDDVDSAEGELQILFAGLSGSAASDFDDGAIFSLEPVDASGNDLGADPLNGLSNLSGGAAVFADSITISNAGSGDDKVEAPAPIPLPAALPVFLIGLSGLGYVARRRQ